MLWMPSPKLILSDSRSPIKKPRGIKEKTMISSRKISKEKELTLDE